MKVIYSLLMGHYRHLIFGERNFFNLHVEYYLNLKWHEQKKKKNTWLQQISIHLIESSNPSKNKIKKK